MSTPNDAPDKIDTLQQDQRKLESKPRLTIGIPTYNRAELLRQQLCTIMPQVEKHQGAVEVLVSDNASTDHTNQVVSAFQREGFFSYLKNEINVGVNANIQSLIEHANGEYFWLQGDDDLLRSGAVDSILKIIEDHPKIDGIFVNNSYHGMNERDNAGNAEVMLDLDPAKYLCKDDTNHLVMPWEDIVLLSDVPGVFTFIGSNILRLSLWKTTAAFLGSHEGFPSLEASFSHSCRIAEVMVGKSAYYVGTPYILLFVGAQSWFSYWPMIQMVRLTEYSDFLKSLGASKKAVDKYRECIFDHPESWHHCHRLLREKDIPGKEYFSLWTLVRKYYSYASLWRMLSKVLQSELTSIRWRIRERLSPLKKRVKVVFFLLKNRNLS